MIHTGKILINLTHSATISSTYILSKLYKYIRIISIFRALRDINLEDMEGLDKDQGHDKKINVNGILTENENIKRSKEKKKKHKDDEKSKKKKRKKVDDYAVCSADDEKRPNSSNNINLWLEDVNLQATSPVLQDIDDKSSKTKKKKEKKKHKRRERSRSRSRSRQRR